MPPLARPRGRHPSAARAPGRCGRAVSPLPCSARNAPARGGGDPDVARLERPRARCYAPWMQHDRRYGGHNRGLIVAAALSGALALGGSRTAQASSTRWREPPVGGEGERSSR
jgi:hypothetical protein